MFGGAGRHEGDRDVHLLHLEKELQSDSYLERLEI